MCSERYAEDIPFLLPNTQFPPTRSDFSKQSNGIPRSCSAFAAAMPDEPAPTTQATGSSDMDRPPWIELAGTRRTAGGIEAAKRTLAKDDGGVKFVRSGRRLARQVCARRCCANSTNQ